MRRISGAVPVFCKLGCCEFVFLFTDHLSKFAQYEDLKAKLLA